MKFSDDFPIRTHPDCPLNTLYFLPTGSKTWDIVTGRTLELAPGYWCNPKSLAVITDMEPPKK